MYRPHPSARGRPALMCYHSKEYDKIPIRGLAADGGKADPRRNGGWSTHIEQGNKTRYFGSDSTLE